jgi:hypothetical protein
MLEERQLLAGFPPLAVEQLFLEQLNDARADPAAYGTSIGLDLSGIAPSQPLAFDPGLIEAARLHSQDMNARDYFSHITPEGYDPGQRITAAGFAWTSWGESIAAGSAYPGPSDALRGLIIDSGVPDLGHRRHLLAIDTLFQGQNQVGIGIVQAGTGPYTNYYTIDTASSADSRPILTGVVMNDMNGDGKYEIGEGLAGVTITVSGIGSTTTFDSGGYSIAVNPGVYTVTASGGGLAAPITRTIAVGLTNYRLNFAAADDAYVQKLYQTILGRTGSPFEVAGWVTALQGAVGPAGVAAGFEHSAEARARLVESWYSTYLGRVPATAEVQAWVGAMMSGATEEEVQADILGSNEFFFRVNSRTIAGDPSQKYVQSLFALLLGRAPSSSELQSVLTLLSTEDRSTLALGFLYSAEHRADVICAYYVDLLHRTTLPSTQEVDGWVNSGLSLVDVRSAFEGSQEFFVNG